MADPPAEGDGLAAVGERIEHLLEELQSSSEARTWMRIEELVRLLTELYGAGMARTLELLDPQPAAVRGLATDELVGSLLVLHGLHPDDLVTRAARAIDQVTPSVTRAGAALRLDGADEGTAAVAVTIVGGGGCGSTAETLRQMVMTELSAAVPDAEVEVRVETVTEPTPIRLGRKPASAGTSR